MIENTVEKERTTFDHAGNTIVTEDREIRILAKYEAPLVVVLGNVLSNEECDELIKHSRERRNLIDLLSVNCVLVTSQKSI